MAVHGGDAHSEKNNFADTARPVRSSQMDRASAKGNEKAMHISDIEFIITGKLSSIITCILSMTSTVF